MLLSEKLEGGRVKRVHVGLASRHKIFKNLRKSDYPCRRDAFLAARTRFHRIKAFNQLHFGSHRDKTAITVSFSASQGVHHRMLDNPPNLKANSLFK